VTAQSPASDFGPTRSRTARRSRPSVPVERRRAMSRPPSAVTSPSDRPARRRSAKRLASLRCFEASSTLNIRRPAGAESFATVIPPSVRKNSPDEIARRARETAVRTPMTSRGKSSSAVQAHSSSSAAVRQAGSRGCDMRVAANGLFSPANSPRPRDDLRDLAVASVGAGARGLDRSRRCIDVRGRRPARDAGPKIIDHLFGDAGLVGRAGTGEIMIRPGFIRSISSTVIWSLRTTRMSRPASISPSRARGCR